MLGDQTRKTDDDLGVGSGVGWGGWAPFSLVRFVANRRPHFVKSLGAPDFPILGRFVFYLLCVYFVGVEVVEPYRFVGAHAAHTRTARQTARRGLHC